MIRTKSKTLFYLTKTNKISGSSFKEINKSAQLIRKQIQSKSKRSAYVRSKFFKKEKIFLNLFWPHLHEKHEKERIRRLKFFHCAIDLIENSTITPHSIENPMNHREKLHKFIGKTKNGEIFFVQIKENKKSHKKYFISCFPK